MKLKRVSCTQFAGVRDFELSLSEGINVVYGKNETGKSTLVHLLSRTLFQNAKLDGRRDKEFLDLFFPAAKKGGGVVGDFADGKIVLETERGTYTLTKEWGADARCVLSAPDGVIRDQTAIDAALKELLVYGEGVYSDVLLSPQSASEASLRTLLDASKKTDAKREIVSAVSQAVAECGGISVDAIEQAICAKIEDLAGKHWDVERNAPARKAGRWSTGLGEVLKAYYRLEDAKAVLKELSALEEEAERTAAVYNEKDACARMAQEDYEDFRIYAGRLALQREQKKELARLEEERLRYEQVLSAWPLAMEQLAAAERLQAEEKARVLHSQYASAKELQQRVQAVEMRVRGKEFPSAQETSDVHASQRRVAAWENMLCGMNLSAVLKMFQGHSVEVRSVRTGELLDIAQDVVSITEAVTITVPGVMELQLAPASVDAADIEKRIAREKLAVQTIFDKYEVSSLEQLEELEETRYKAEREHESLQTRLDMVLDGVTFDELASQAEKLPPLLRDDATVTHEIVALCGKLDVGRFITAKETVIESYERDYENLETLKARLEGVAAQIALAKAAVDEEAEIPMQYRSVSDPSAHLKMLENVLSHRRQEREDALTARTSAASRLETCRSGIVVDPEYEAERAEAVFCEKNSLLKHWLHIAEVFAQQKEHLHSDPMLDIADHFARNLELISGGQVSSEFPEGDKLDMQIYSSGRFLDYGKLSEGTKETVALAFRLAVLDHLFPEGGGLVVLDDPLTDMDAERTMQACALIKACAKRHQVIFLTCKEEYAGLLGAVPICLTR